MSANPAIHIEITSGVINLPDIQSSPFHADCGAVSTFIGTTRRTTGERKTIELRYEAYEPMALSEMRRLAVRAAERWPLKGVTIIHRTGVVPVGEASVFIGVSAPHRSESFDACRFLIDTLKETVPIWKKELFEDGSDEWVKGNFPEV